jgi:hypothetical protein|nr:MAG TPA: hypothetical protein [Caudoviricetes sp.]DAU30021.1 MAG TPA: hypothetical protein [Caudoviricetes sp.]
MKLYIYRFWGDEFSCSEVDVEEKPKTYIITKECEFGYKGQRIRKDEIGALSGYNRDTVILTEKDKKKAVEMLINRQGTIVESCRVRLEYEEKKLETIKAELEKE